MQVGLSRIVKIYMSDRQTHDGILGHVGETFPFDIAKNFVIAVEHHARIKHPQYIAQAQLTMLRRQFWLELEDKYNLVGVCPCAIDRRINTPPGFAYQQFFSSVQFG